MDTAVGAGVDESHQALRAALERLAALTAREQLTEASGCTHCVPPEEQAVLSGPAEAVPDDLVSYVAGDAASMWDDFPSLYRRLSPRILGMLADGSLHVSESQVGTNLAQAGWESWPGGVAQAVREVLDALWLAVLSAPPGTPSVDEVLRLLVGATGTVTPWLAVWAGLRSPAADLHLADLFEDWFGDLYHGGLVLDSLRDQDFTAEVAAWFLAQGPDRLTGPLARERLARLASAPSREL